MQYGYGKIIGVKKLSIIIFFMILGLVVFSVYYRNVSLELGIFTSVITFVYGFFLNSLFSFVQKKYIDFSTNMADLSASIQSFYNLMRNANQPAVFNVKVKEILVRFIESFKTLHPKDYTKHQSYIDEIYMAMKGYRIKDKKQEILLSRIINTINAMSTERERTEFFGERYLVGETKYVFLILTGIVAATVLALSLQAVQYVMFGIILIFALIFESYLLFDLDSVSYGYHKIRHKNLDELLSMIKGE